MRFTLTVTILVLSFAAAAQTGLKAFEIKGTLSDEIDSIRISYNNGNGQYIRRTVLNTAGHFEVSDSLDIPVGILLKAFSDKNGGATPHEFNFYVEAGMNRVSLEGTPLKLNGPKNSTQTDFESLNQSLLACCRPEMDELYRQKDSLQHNKEDDQEITERQIAMTDSLLNLLREEESGVVMNFIKSHPKSFISLYKMYWFWYTHNPEILLTTFKNLDTFIQASKEGVILRNRLHAKINSQVGYKPELKMAPTLSDKNFNLKDYLAKGPVLIDFWASWCEPCIEDLPDLIKLKEQFSDFGLQIVFISIDNDKQEAWRHAITKHHLEDFQHYLVEGMGMDRITEQLAVTAIPDKILFDKSGRIIYRNVGSGTESLKKALLQLKD